MIKTSFLDWCDTKGFYVKNVWDLEKGKWIGPGYMQWFPWQRRIFRHVFTPNEHGILPYSTIVISQAKKSGKSIIGSAVGAWVAEEGPDHSEIYPVANDQEQASRLYEDVVYHAEKSYQLRGTKKELEFPNGSKIVPLAQHYSSAAGTRHILSLWDELWAYCKSEDTEIYCRDGGWKHYTEINPGDAVATLNIETDTWEWQPLKEVNAWRHAGEMVHLEHRRADQLMTVNHKVVGKFRTSGHNEFGDTELREARDAMKSYEMRLPKSGWVGEDDPSIAGDMLELAGYYVAEGWKAPDSRGTYIAQKDDIKPTKGNVFGRIRDNLDALGLVYGYKRGCFYLNAENDILDFLHSFGCGAENKFIPRHILDLPPHKLQRFFDAYMLGDGWVAGDGWQCRSTSHELISNLVEIGIKLGYYSKFMGSKPGQSENSRPTYRASFSRGNILVNGRNWSIEEFDGVVWCPTVENGTWLSRRNGKVAWTGNTSERSQRMWTEMTPPPTIPGAFRLVVTYAGFENESTLLWNLYEENWLKGTPIPQLSDMVNTQGDPVCRARGKTFVFWDDQHRLPWQTEEYYDDQRRQLRPADFLRIHCNMWVSSADTFITDDLLDSREVLSGPLHSDPDEKKRRMPIWVGVDVAPKHDSCAVVAVGMDEAAGRIRLADYRIFYPDASKQIFDINETVTETVKQFHQMYNLQAVYYDPYQFHQPSVDLRKFGVNMIEFNQTVNNMTEVTQALFESLNTATLDFYRAPDLVDHLKYATAKATPRGFRLVKQKNAKYKIDAAVALAMAVFAAIYGSYGRVTGVPMTIDFPYSDVAEQVAPKDPEWLPFELRR